MARAPHVQSDYDELFSFLAEFAEQLLKKQGTFYPFAATVSSSGEVAAFGVVILEMNIQTQTN